MQLGAAEAGEDDYRGAVATRSCWDDIGTLKISRDAKPEASSMWLYSSIVKASP